MTKVARNGIIAFLAFVLCVCLAFLLVPTFTWEAKAEGTPLEGTPFVVEDGTLTNELGKEGIIVTKDSYEIKNELIVILKFTLMTESIDFYLGENMNYWLRVTTEGIAPGVWVANTAIGEDMSSMYNRFIGANFSVGDEIDLRITCRKGSMTFKLNGTELSAKVNSEGKDANMWKNTAKYTVKTEYAANLSPLRVGISCNADQQASFTEFRLAETIKSVFLDTFDNGLLEENWISKDKVEIKNGALVLPRNNNRTITTDDAIVKDGQTIGLRVKIPYGKMTVKMGDESVAIDSAAVKADDWSNVIIDVDDGVAVVLVDGEVFAACEVTEAVPLALAFEGNDSAIIDHLRVFDMTGQILNDEFTYMNGDIWDGLTTMDLDLAELLVPIWEGTTAYQEGLWVVAEANGTVADINLLHKINRIVEITSMDGKTVYQEGVDYTVTADGKLRILEGTSIPVMSYSAYHSGGALGVYYQADNLWQERQVKVTYTFAEDKKITNPETKSNLLSKTLSKLENGERVNVVTFGDSITEGASVTGHPFSATDLGRAPYQKSWSRLLGEALQALYPQADVNLQSSGFGGTGSSWAFGGHGAVESSDYAAYRDYVVPYDPDLIVLAFGMNDSGTSTGYYNAAFVSVLLAGLQAACPDAEIILVTPMMQNLETIPGRGENNPVMCLVGMAEAYLSHETTGIAVADVAKMHQQILGLTRKPDTTTAEQFGFTEWYLEQTGVGKNFRDTSGNNFNHPNDYLSRVYAQTILKTLTDKTIPLTTTASTAAAIEAYYTSNLPLITQKEIRSFRDRFGAVLVDENGSLAGYVSTLSLSADIAIPETEVTVTAKDFTDTLTVKTEEYAAMELIATYENTDTVIYPTTSLEDLRKFITLKVSYNDGSQKKTGTYELSGTLTAGDCEITITAQNLTTTITVTVADITVQSISAAVKGGATLYASNTLEDVMAALTVTASYSDGSTAEITDFTVSSVRPKLIPGENEITVTVGDLTTTVTVTVEEVTLASITATFDSGNQSVYEGDAVEELSAYVTVTGMNNDGSEATVEEFTIALANGQDVLSVGENEIVITVGEISTTVTVTAKELELVSITAGIDMQGVILYKGDLLETIAPYLTVIGKNNNGTTFRIEEFTLSLPYEVTVLSAGENTVTVCVGDLTCTVTVVAEDVTVAPPTVEPTTTPSVEASVAPTATPSVEDSVPPSKDDEDNGSSCGAVATGGNGGNAGGMTLLVTALLAVAFFLFKKKTA